MVSEDSTRNLLERILHDANEEPVALPLSFLKSITNNFSDDQIVGCGGFAVVYKGLLPNGIVAVKKLSQTLEVHEKEFNQEVDSLMRVKHTNIVRFLGYCADTQGKVWKYEGKNVMADDRQRLLCFEFMQKGSLDKYISDASGGLEWMTRYQIIKGICQGLNYLHEKKIVHLDLKPANILLDYCMVPKIADFGVSKCFDEKQTRAITLKCVGSLGYMAPEYLCNREITLKSDIYSLGVIIMEIVTGRKGYPDVNNVLDGWSSRLGISHVDKRLEHVSVCLGIAIDCIDPNPAMRPATGRIIEMLDQMERHSHDSFETDRCTSLEPHCLLRSMEATAACVPCDFDQADTHHEPTEQAAQECEDDLHNMEMKINNSISVFEKAAQELNLDMDIVGKKIHRCPAMIRQIPAFCDYYAIPMVVAIGPYHHHRSQLIPVENVKHVAAYQCIMESGHSVQDMYDAIVTAAYHARSLYDKDVMEGISEDDFINMMFYDACFLVQYFACCTDVSSTMDPSLRGFFDFNRKAIRHDIVLLENQIPWRVVEAVLRFRPMDLNTFVKFWKHYLQDHKVLSEKPLVFDGSFEPPHLLGLLRFYIVGKGSTMPPIHVKTKMISFSVIANELAENGIKLKANKESMELIDMGINKRGIFAELSMVPLSLDDERASFLINMAALEMCTTSNFLEAEPEESAVCSYLLLLSQLVHTEKDVQELRTKHLLQRGAGLVNKDALTFFTGLRSLPLRGSKCYVHIMMEIESYKVKRRMQIKIHAFFYKNKRTIFALFSVVVVLVSILGTLMSLKKHSVV